MAKEFNLEDFQNMISLFNMKVSHKLVHADGNKFILETWISDINPYLRLTRLIEFNKDNLNNLEPENRKKLLKQMLDDAVEEENYEEAAQIRDMILQQ
jgi:excinuclease UvrABC helicase subunit UvrB